MNNPDIFNLNRGKQEKPFELTPEDSEYAREVFLNEADGRMEPEREIRIGDKI